MAPPMMVLSPVGAGGIGGRSSDAPCWSAGLVVEGLVEGSSVGELAKEKPASAMPPAKNIRITRCIFRTPCLRPPINNNLDDGPTGSGGLGATRVRTAHLTQCNGSEVTVHLRPVLRGAESKRQDYAQHASQTNHSERSDPRFRRPRAAGGLGPAYLEDHHPDA